MSLIASKLELAELLLQRYDYPGLLGLYDQLTARPDGLSRAELARLEFLAGQACESLNRFKLAGEHLLRAREIYESLALPREALKAELGRIFASRSTEPFSQIIFEANRALEHSRSAGWVAEEAEALVVLASANRSRHNYADVIDFCRLAFELLDSNTQKLLYSRAASTLSWALNALGRHDEGEEYMRSAFEVYRGLKDQSRLRRELGNFAFQAWCRGEVERARVLTQEQMDSATVEGDPAELALARFNMAIYETHLGNWEEARRLALLAWQRPAMPLRATLESALLMLLGLGAIHMLRPAEGLNYLRLSEGAMRDTGNDESILLDYYMALGLLAAGAAPDALARWSQRRELCISVENRIEVRWMLRTLELVSSSEFTRLLSDAAATHRAVAALELGLLAWLRRAEAVLAPSVLRSAVDSAGAQLAEAS